MSNFRKTRLFGKREKFNLFVFVCAVLVLGLVVYLTSISFKDSRVQTNNNTDLAQNSGFENELNTNNEGYIDNAIQVKDNNNLNEIQNIDKDVASSDVSNQTLPMDSKNFDNKPTNDGAQSNVAINQEQKDVASVTTEETIPVSSTSSIVFSAPVDGTLVRPYTTDTIYSKTLNTWRTREGIDLKAEVGTPVVAVLDGVVEKIDNDLTERGQYVVVKHDDGFKTVYTNLDEEVKVVNGQKVRKGEIIGTVGVTSGNYSNEDYGSHLNFVMYLNNEEVNPADYINFK